MAETQEDLLQQLAAAEDTAQLMLVEQKFAVLDQRVK
jgi:hypothetical protein